MHSTLKFSFLNYSFSPLSYVISLLFWHLNSVNKIDPSIKPDQSSLKKKLVNVARLVLAPILFCCNGVSSKPIIKEDDGDADDSNDDNNSWSVK